MSRTATARAIVTLLAVGLGASACSVQGSTTTQVSPSSAPSTPSASTSPQGAQVIGPVIVTLEQTEVTAGVGRYLYFKLPADQIPGAKVSSDNAAVVELTQATDDGTTQSTAGGRILAAGTATLTVTLTDSTTRSIILTAVP